MPRGVYKRAKRPAHKAPKPTTFKDLQRHWAGASPATGEALDAPRRKLPRSHEALNLMLSRARSEGEEAGYNEGRNAGRLESADKIKQLETATSLHKEHVVNSLAQFGAAMASFGEAMARMVGGQGF